MYAKKTLNPNTKLIKLFDINPIKKIDNTTNDA